ncbi:ABC transporter permease [Demequina sp. SO4-13]|uniref:ABC transporter permease n=1 Tax=Demequina sp. SO4-13 TaxID=3401027 RepID=UPI003AF50FD1
MSWWADFMNSGLRLTTPILFAAIASLLSARVGILNLAIEAKVLGGAFVAILVTAATGNVVVGVVAAAAFGSLIGFVMAMADRLGVDLVVLAIGLNMLLLQATVFFMRAFLDGVGTYNPDIETLGAVEIPVLSSLPLLGRMLGGMNVLVYGAFLVALAVVLFLRTRAGRHVVAVGDAPAAAASAGINVKRTQLRTLLAAGAIAGLEGAYLSVGDLGLFTRNMSSDRGWIGITAALLAVNMAAYIAPAAMVFGFAAAASIRLQEFGVPGSVTQFIPQGAALVALILVGVRTTSRQSLLHLWRHSSRIRWRTRPPTQPAEGNSEPAPPAPTRQGEQP